MTRLALAACLLAAAAATASAQVGSLSDPPRDGRGAPPPPRTGTAVVRGRIVDALSGAPIVRVHVRLQPIDGGSGPTAVTTDDAGSFTFRSLAAGSYTLDIDKTTYLHTRYPEPGKTIRTSSRHLSIADGESPPPITIPLSHGSVISGRVVDANGDPIESASVQLLAVPSSGRGRLTPRAGGGTNDVGEFRLAHVEPGRYLLLVVPRNNGMADGPLYVEGRPGSPDAAVVEPQALPTFYPGVASADQAQPITIRRGESALGLELPVVESFAARVSGTVVDGSGAPVGCCGGLQIRPIVTDVPFFGGSGAPIRPDGTFSTRLAPGEYELTATMTPRSVNGPLPPDSQRFGRTTISVNGDLSDITLVVGRGARVTGKLVLEGSSTLPDIASNPNVMMVAMNGPRDGRMCRSGRLAVKPDLTFTIDGVFGTCTPSAVGSVGAWSVKSVQYGGKELLDEPVAFEADQELRNVRVVLSDKHTELAVRATDGGGALTSDFVALVFSTDRSKWREESPSLRLVPGFMGSSPRPPASTGPVQPRTIVNLPAGEYFAIAIDDISSDGWRDAGLLEQLAAAATRVTLVDGSPAEVTLRRQTLAELVPER